VRGVKFEIKEGEEVDILIPEDVATFEPNKVASEAFTNVSNWLGFGNTNEYRLCLKSEKRAIFKRARY